MADNYLEKRHEEVFGAGAGKRKSRPSLDSLLLKNRSYRGFDGSYAVLPRQLDSIVAVNTKLGSGMNAQRLRFRCVCGGEDASKVLSLIKLAGAHPEWNLPLPGTEPRAFIIVCATCEENPIVDIDLGMSLEAMTLKAVEMGLGGVIVRCFDADALRSALSLPLQPLIVLALGKPVERIELVPVHAGDSLKYYRENGVHYVPKLTLEDIKL